MSYSHTQRSPLGWLFFGMVMVVMVLASILRGKPVIPYVLVFYGVFVLILASSFHHLTVADEGDRLAIRFGPLPLFRKRVPYEEIQSAEVGRTSILDGWGIHMSLKGGWVWNLWGRDCVVLRLRKGFLRVGTDDAENLARFLATRIHEADD